jgi:hypothetical protein
MTDPDDGQVLYEKIPSDSKKIVEKPLDIKMRGVYDMCFSVSGPLEG